MAVFRVAVQPAAPHRKQRTSQPCLTQAFRCVMLIDFCALSKLGYSRFWVGEKIEFFSVFIVWTVKPRMKSISPGEFGFQPSESEMQPSMSSLHRLIPLCPCHLWKEQVTVSFKSFWAWGNKWTHSSVCSNNLVQNLVWKFCTKYYGKPRLGSLGGSLVCYCSFLSPMTEKLPPALFLLC